MKTYKERTEDILAKAKEQKRARASRNKKLAAGLSCSLAAVLVLNLALFLPRWNDRLTFGGNFGDKLATAESLQEVEERLSSLLKDPPDQYWTNTPGSEEDRPGFEETGPEGGRIRLEDAQAEGFTRGDLLVRGNKTAFYLTSDLRLQAYSVATASLIGQIAIEPEGGYTFRGNVREMYLRDDLSAALVFTTAYDPATRLTYTAVIGVETKDPATMSVTGVQYISGDYISSRMADGKFLVVSELALPYDSGLPEEALLPKTGVFGNMKPLPASRIFLPEEARAPLFTVVTTLSEEGEFLDTRALFSFSGDLYVSETALYATCAYLAPSDGEGENLFTAATDVVRIAYNGTGNLALTAKTTVGGLIADPLSMDEYGGMLRVFATTRTLSDPNGDAAEGDANASLFVYDADTLAEIAAAEHFAPAGEGVRAARFEGDAAYACTAADLSRPLFAFDLSDLPAISCNTGGTPPAYSLFLTKFSGGFIGLENENGSSVGITFYDDSANPLFSVKEEYVTGAPASDRAYFIEGARGLFGFAATDLRESAKNFYYLFSLKDASFQRLARVALSCSPENARAFAENGMLYVFDGSLTAYLLP